MMLLLVIAAVVCVANAAFPCQAPGELSFRAARHNYGDTYFRRYSGEYDRSNARVVLFEESFFNGTRDGHEFLFLHRVDLGFDLDFRNRRCIRFPSGPFRPFEVPFNSTFEGEFQLGGPNEAVVVDRWSDRIPGRRRETWIGEFSLANCYPISQFVVDETDFNRTSITHFYNVVQGVVNPNDFEVPRECFNATYVPEIPKAALYARAVYSKKLFV
ncbi:unnamed protein product [Candidula unifasciata]|uniref:Ependymin related protein-1 n=1 Tax=Candidula unifasciata TaxID=100452 RepID=A0A8S3Z1N2_9EUPU|nr:unnamed protein product [Candidula unifasciata]